MSKLTDLLTTDTKYSKTEVRMMARMLESLANGEVNELIIMYKSKMITSLEFITRVVDVAETFNLVDPVESVYDIAT